MSADDRIAFLERRVADLEKRFREAESEAHRATIRLRGVRTEMETTFYTKFMEVVSLMMGVGVAVMISRRSPIVAILFACGVFLSWWQMQKVRL